MNSLTPKHKSMLLMVVTALLWGIGGIFIKLIDCNPFLIAGLRSVIAAIILGSYMYYKKIPFKICKATWAAGVGLGGSAILFVLANKLTTAANAVVLQYSAPIFIVIITAIILKRGLKKKEVLVVTVSMIGIVLVFFDQLSPGNLLGNVLGVLAGILFAIMFVGMGEASSDDSIRMSGILLAHFIASIIGLPIGGVLTTSITGTDILFIVILGVFQLGIPYVMYSIASKDCPPLACSLIGMLEPLLNPVWVAIFVGEMPGPFAFIGGAVIIITVGWWCFQDD